MSTLLPASEPLDATRWIARRCAREGGRALLVGGCVRDALLGLDVEDFDIEVFGLEGTAVQRILGSRFRVSEVGASFGVFKIHGAPIDVSLPRRERSTGPRHVDFATDVDPAMSVEEAALRRDFTINAISWDPLEDELLDPVRGLDDLRNRLLRHTSPRFVEDPLRVLRGMQFVARLTLEPDPGTVALAATVSAGHLAAERIFAEWRKLIEKGVAFEGAFDFLAATGWIEHFPEVAALAGCEQDPEWHPEGDVLRHTALVLDAFARERSGDAWEDLVVGFGCLCHDFGKPQTTLVEDGRLRAKGHEEGGVAPTEKFLERMRAPAALIREVTPLVAHHLKPMQLYQAQASDAAVRRLARKVRVDRLLRVAAADSCGRPPLPDTGADSRRWLQERSEALAVAREAPRPLVQGRHLIAEGVRPGPRMGELLARLFELQLDGEFSELEAGIALFRERFAGSTAERPEARDGSAEGNKP